MNTSTEPNQRTGPLGEVVAKPEPPPPKPDAEGNVWRFYKRGLEISQQGQLRTIAK